MLSPRRGCIWLGQARPVSALDARRHGPGGLGHGDRRVGSLAGANHRSYRADRQRTGRGLRAASDIATGTYTIMAQVAADLLGLPIESISIKLGDSTLPRAPIEGGSWMAASVSNVI